MRGIFPLELLEDVSTSAEITAGPSSLFLSIVVRLGTLDFFPIPAKGGKGIAGAILRRACPFPGTATLTG